MGHHSVRGGYADLVRRLNRLPTGAPPSELLYQILKLLFTEKDAQLAALLPIRPFKVRDASRAWRVSEAEACRKLDELSDRALLIDIESEKGTWYVVPPPMAGFFEFSMMRVRGDIDQKLLSELFYQYINVEEDFIKSLFTDGKTQIGRMIVCESVLSGENALEVLDHERASAIIRTASSIGIGICYCRHKMSHLGRACGAPLEVCMVLNVTAESLIRHGHARRIDAAEAIDIIQRAYGENLVQFGENVTNGVNFICNCCRCCCDAMITARRFGLSHPVHTTGFLPDIDINLCTGCGNCSRICPVEAVYLVAAEHGKKASVNESLCLGCGICLKACHAGAVALERRRERIITPVDSFERTVMMAVERGKLQNLIFDRQGLWSHRVLAAVLGAVLRLPPVKKKLAERQLGSRYVEALIARSLPPPFSSSQR